MSDESLSIVAIIFENAVPKFCCHFDGIPVPSSSLKGSISCGIRTRAGETLLLQTVSRISRLTIGWQTLKKDLPILQLPRDFHRSKGASMPMPTPLIVENRCLFRICEFLLKTHARKDRPQISSKNLRRAIADLGHADFFKRRIKYVQDKLTGPAGDSGDHAAIKSLNNLTELVEGRTIRPISFILRIAGFGIRLINHKPATPDISSLRQTLEKQLLFSYPAYLVVIHFPQQELAGNYQYSQVHRPDYMHADLLRFDAGSENRFEILETSTNSWRELDPSEICPPWTQTMVALPPQHGDYAH